MIPKTIILIGRSGSGKGTQAELLNKHFEEIGKESIHLESGKIFRDFINKEKNYTSLLASRVNKEGGLQPQFLSVWAWSENLINNLKEDNSLIIDGTPRRLNEAVILEDAFKFYGRDKFHVIYLNVSHDESVGRLKSRGREDDREMDNIEERLAWFDEDVIPVIDYYRTAENSEFHEISGEGNINNIHQDILDILK